MTSLVAVWQGCRLCDVKHRSLCMSLYDVTGNILQIRANTCKDGSTTNVDKIITKTDCVKGVRSHQKVSPFVKIGLCSLPRTGESKTSLRQSKENRYLEPLWCRASAQKNSVRGRRHTQRAVCICTDFSAYALFGTDLDSCITDW